MVKSCQSLIIALTIVCAWSHFAKAQSVRPVISQAPGQSEKLDESITQGDKLLERTRDATLAAAGAMPDFLVKQLVKRFKCYGTNSDWVAQDNLSIAVGYRVIGGEQYKVLAVNDVPLGYETKTSKNYSKDVAPGVSSSGVEYISAVANVFKPESETTFKLFGADLIQSRQTVVYEYEIKQPLSQLTLRTSESNLVNVGSRGRVWIDREINRVLRFEQVATEIPLGFPITAATSTIDFDWVTIGDRKYLLPFRSEILLIRLLQGAPVQSRNEISFRGYQKFGAELKVIDEIDERDFKRVKP